MKDAVMALPESDESYLSQRGIEYDVQMEAGMTCVVFPNWMLPEGYEPVSSDLMIRLQQGYPDIPPDMWWFGPAVRLASGAPIPNAEVIEQHLGRSWQRWSRHFEPGQWQSGIDGLESYLALIRTELEKYVSL